jgi:transposase
VDVSRPIAQVARELKVSDTTLGFWVKACRKQHWGDLLPMDIPDRARLQDLERRNRELEMGNTFLTGLSWSAGRNGPAGLERRLAARQPAIYVHGPRRIGTKVAVNGWRRIGAKLAVPFMPPRQPNVVLQLVLWCQRSGGDHLAPFAYRKASTRERTR